MTVNRLCASGLSAVVCACQAIRAGEIELAVAGGVESMSRAPLVVGKDEKRLRAGRSHAVRHDARLALSQPAHGRAVPAGEHGRDRRERRRALGDQRARTRTRSRWRASAAGPRADAAGRFARGAGARSGSASATSTRGRSPRPEALAKLRTVFRAGGTVTAGNSIRCQRRRRRARDRLGAGRAAARLCSRWRASSARRRRAWTRA